MSDPNKSVQVNGYNFMATETWTEILRMNPSLPEKYSCVFTDISFHYKREWSYGLSTKLFTFSPCHLYLSPYHLYLLAKSCVMAKKLPTEPVSFSFRPNLMSWQCFLLLIFGHKNNPLMFRSCPYTMTSKECLVSLKSKLSSYNYGCNLPFKYVFCLCWCCSNFYQNKFNIRL